MLSIHAVRVVGDRYPGCSKLMNVKVGEKSIMQFRNMIKEISPFCTHYIPIFIDSHFYLLMMIFKHMMARLVNRRVLHARGLKKRAPFQVKTS